MILHSLEVNNFRSLREVRLTFGRGLNVLFGPNDFGKSSLVEALRTAFLLPVTSAQNREFLPWGTDHVPRVVVVFEKSDTVWKITKEFGSRGSACLERVGESGALLPEAQGRAVEGKLRELFAWGIPVPGGKAAPRGLPQSYLTTALLGCQDQVTAILKASLADDGVDTGRCFVTRALGALSQDPLVGQVMQRLEKRVAEVFTPAGKVKANGPLAERAREINDQEQRLESLSERLRRSEEIERKVQLLTEQSDHARDEYTRLAKHLEWLRAARNANDELEKVRNHKRELDEARVALAVVESEVEDNEARHEQVDAALRTVDNELRALRERLAKASGTRDEVLKNTQNARDARRAELIAKRETAGRRQQAAREVIQSREDVESRVQELAQAEEAHERALVAERRAHDVAGFAELVAQCRQANQAVEVWKTSEKQRADIAEDVSEADEALKKGETALEDAECVVVQKKDALAEAERAATARHLRKEGLRASLIRAETAEQDALQAVAQAKAAIAVCERVREAEKSLAQLGEHEQELEARLAANTAERGACERPQVISNRCRSGRLYWQVLPPQRRLPLSAWGLVFRVSSSPVPRSHALSSRLWLPSLASGVGNFGK